MIAFAHENASQHRITDFTLLETPEELATALLLGCPVAPPGPHTAFFMTSDGPRSRFQNVWSEDWPGELYVPFAEEAK